MHATYQAPKEKPLLTSHYKRYVEAGVNAVEAFALMSDPAATAYFDAVLASGILWGPACRMAGEMLVKHIWYTVWRSSTAESKPCSCTSNAVLHPSAT